MSNPLVPPLSNKKNLYIYGGGALVAVGGFLYFKRKNAAASAAASVAAAASTDPNSPGYVDPSLNPGTNGYGDYSAASGVVPSLYGYNDPTSGNFIGGYGTATVITGPTSNAQWAQQANGYLQSLGYNGAVVALALGKYLGGQNLSASQLEVVQAAIGSVGNPPVAVPPPHVAPPTGHPKTTVPPGGLVAPHLTVGRESTVTAALNWTPVPGATAYRLMLNGMPIAVGFTQTTHQVPRHSGPWHVQATNGRTVGRSSNAVTVK